MRQFERKVSMHYSYFGPL